MEQRRLRRVHSWRAVNAERELADEDSVYNFYRRALRLRKESRTVREGTFRLLWPDDERIFAYEREYEGERLTVLCNFSSETVPLPEPGTAPGECLICNYAGAGEPQVLRPWEARVVRSEVQIS